MKRIEFIAPVESMRGNLSGGQSLEYADNNNPAYEAPNGVQYARNYQPRFIGAKRSADGLKYYSVRTKSATNLKASTRRAMAIVGVTAAIRSALMSAHAADYAKMQQAFNYLKAQGLLPEGQNTFKKWFDANVKQMLVYKSTRWTFTQAGISFTLNNPYNLASADALVIKKSIWVKFATIFLITASTSKAIVFTIDGYTIPAVVSRTEGGSWGGLITTAHLNVNYASVVAGLEIEADNVLFNDSQVYLDDVAQTGDDLLVEAAKYTTAAIG